MAFPFQVVEVVRPLRVDAVRAVAVSYKVGRRVPKGARAAVRKCAEQLKVATAALVDAREARGSAATVDNRLVVLALVNAWGALYGRLDSLTKLDAAEAPQSAEARVVLDEVFTQSKKGSLKAEHDAIWIESEARLARIDRDGRAEVVERLAGDFVLKIVRKAHRAAGLALGLHGAGSAEASESVALKPLLDAVTAAIAAYAIQLIASVNEDDGLSEREVAYALDPIVQQRRRPKGRVVEEEGEDPIDAPVDEKDAVVTKAITVDAPAANDTAAAKGRRVA